MENTNQIQPLFDRVLLKPREPTQNRAGIIIPRDTLERSQTMTVLTTGPDPEICVSPGDTVIVARYAGTEVATDCGQKLLLVKHCEILAKVRNRP